MKETKKKNSASPSILLFTFICLSFFSSNRVLKEVDVYSDLLILKINSSHSCPETVFCLTTEAKNIGRPADGI